jgi:hypothetical protein
MESIMSDYRFGGCDSHHERGDFSHKMDAQYEFELLAGISSDLMQSHWTKAF